MKSPETPTAIDSPPDPVPAGSGAYRNYVLGLLFLVYVFNFIDRRILAMLLEPIKKDLGASDTEMGLLIGPAFGIFYTFAGIPIARWADFGVRRSIIALCLALWSALTALSGQARTFAHLALLRAGVGIGEAGCSPPAHSLISDYFPPRRRATAISIYTTGIYVGILLSYALVGYLENEYGWRTAFVVAGLPGLALALVVRFTVREPERGHAEHHTADAGAFSVGDVFRFLWRLRSFRHLALGAALNSFAGYGLGNWLPAFLGRVHAMDRTDIGLWLGLTFGLGGAVGALAGGFLCDRFGTRDPRWHLRIPALATILSLPLTVLALVWPTRSGSLILLVPAIVLGALYLGPIFSLTQGLVKLRMRALAAAVLLFIMNIIGMGLGPLGIGATSDLFQGFGLTDGASLQYALVLAAGIRIWAAVHFFLGAKTLVADLGRKNGARLREPRS